MPTRSFVGSSPQASWFGWLAIALSDKLVEELVRWKAEQDRERALFGAGYPAGGFVFSQPNGKPLHAHNLSQRDFRRVFELRGLRKELLKQGIAENALPKPLRRIKFHALRHVHASYLALAGVPLKVAQERLGHATPTFTLRVYTHTLAGQQEAAARAVEGLLLG